MLETRVARWHEDQRAALDRLLELSVRDQVSEIPTFGGLNGHCRPPESP